MMHTMVEWHLSYLRPQASRPADLRHLKTLKI
jgi:hypothetical protein